MLFFGIEIMTDWLFLIFRQVTYFEYTLLWISFLCIMALGLELGIILGFVVAIIFFTISYARVDPLVSLSRRRSTVLRNVEERNVLLKNENRILTFSMHGYIFFGSSLQVVQRVERECESQFNLNKHSPAFVVIDFGRVPGIDATAARSFSMLQSRLERKFHAKLLFSSITKPKERSVKRLLMNHGAITPNFGCFHSMDSALAHVEDAILSLTRPTAREIKSSLSLAEILNEYVIPSHLMRWERAALQVSVKQNRKLMKYFEMRRYETSCWLFKEGESPHHLFIVHTGCVKIYRRHRVSGNEENNRGEMLASSGSWIGDLDFILERPRSLSAYIDASSNSHDSCGTSLFVLSRAKYHQVIMNWVFLLYATKLQMTLNLISQSSYRYGLYSLFVLMIIM